MLSKVIVAITALVAAQSIQASLITDGLDGLLPGTDLRQAHLDIGASTTTFSMIFDGPVDLWESSPDTGLTQVFLSVDRASVDDNRFGPEGGSDIQFVHDVPRGNFIAQSLGSQTTSNSSSVISVTSNRYEMIFATSLFGPQGILDGEAIEWGLVLTSAQSPATFDQVALTGSYTRGREVFRSNSFTYTAQVPVPATLALLGLGLLGLRLRRRT